MYVNLNACKLKCTYCNFSCCTKEIASKIVFFLQQMNINEFGKNIEIILQCPSCNENFIIRVLVRKKGLIYFLEDWEEKNEII